MNRYTVAGVLADMRKGRRVLVLAGTQNLARAAFVEAARSIMPGERVRRANGDEEINVEGGDGRVLFRSIGSGGYRGLSVDVVVFAGLLPTREMLQAIRPNLAASLLAEVVRP